MTSTPASGDTYGLGETIRVTLTFSEAVSVTGTPRLEIDMDPAHWGQKWAAYESGSGTTTLIFTHKVAQPNISTQGIAVLANTLELNGGAIKIDDHGGRRGLCRTRGWPTTQITRWTGDRNTRQIRGGLCTVYRAVEVGSLGGDDLSAELGRKLLGLVLRRMLDGKWSASTVAALDSERRNIAGGNRSEYTQPSALQRRE